MTSRAPGLDPERVEAAQTAATGGVPPTVRDYYNGLVELALAADDAHARENGLVATGDQLTRAMLAGLVDVGLRARAIEPTESSLCVCLSCRAGRALAALPSSLLDNPKVDRGD